MLGAVLLTFSCGGSPVEADRIAEGDRVAISYAGSVVDKPLRDTDAVLASRVNRWGSDQLWNVRIGFFKTSEKQVRSGRLGTRFMRMAKALLLQKPNV